MHIIIDFNGQQWMAYIHCTNEMVFIIVISNRIMAEWPEKYTQVMIELVFERESAGCRMNSVWCFAYFA